MPGEICQYWLASSCHLTHFTSELASEWPSYYMYKQRQVNCVTVFINFTRLLHAFHTCKHTNVCAWRYSCSLVKSTLQRHDIVHINLYIVHIRALFLNEMVFHNVQVLVNYESFGLSLAKGVYVQCISLSYILLQTSNSKPTFYDCKHVWSFQ